MACSCFSFLKRPAAPANGCHGRAPAANAGTTLRILTANDIYKPERLAMLKTLVEEQRAGATASKFVLPGDLLGGSLFATVHHGESVVEVLNTLQVDYCTLGNHEFDYGAERTVELMDRSRFPWLGSNVRWSGEGGGIFHNTKDFDIFELRGGSVGSVKVGVFGLCTPATRELAHPGPSVQFEPPVQHARRCVRALQEQGCELIIALTHLSLAMDKQVAEEVPGIRAILGGHDHDPFLLVHRGTFIAKCGQNADHLGVLDLHLDRDAPGALLHAEHSFRLLSTALAVPDPGVLAAAEPFRGGSVKDSLCAVEDLPLTTKSQELRARENAFACYVADAIRWSYREQGCELVVQNGGFIRNDATYPAGSLITAQQVREEMPFPKRPVLLRATGAELRRGLEEMLAPTPVATGSFPHLSGNARVVYDPDRPKFSKITSLEVGGQPVDPDREYLVGVSEFYVMQAGDGVTPFVGKAAVASHGRLTREVAVEYLRHLGSVSGRLPGRLTVGR